MCKHCVLVGYWKQSYLVKESVFDPESAENRCFLKPQSGILLNLAFRKIDFKILQDSQLNFYQNALKLVNLRFFEAAR